MSRLFLLLLLPLSSFAGDTVSRPGVLHLTLDSAIRMALARNFSIEIQSYSPDIARAGVMSQLGRFDPVLDLSATRSESTQRDALRDGLRTPLNSVSRTDRVSTGISGLTPWGLTYDAGLGTRNATGSASRFGEDFASDATVSLRQPLLRGFGTDVNLASLRIARNNVEISEWELRRRIIDVITEVTFTYNDLHSSHEGLNVAIRSRDRARQLLTDNTRRAEIGVMPPLSITTARAEAAQRQEAVIVAQRAVKDNENFLKNLITRDMEPMLEVRVEIEPPLPADFTSDKRAGFVDAFNLRPDYQQAILDLRRLHINVVVAKNQALPRFDLTGSLSLLGLDNDFGTSVSRISRRDSTDWSAGAIVSIPLLNREARGEAEAAKLRAVSGLVDLHRIEQDIVVRVDNAYGRIFTDRERIASTTEARKLAQESLDAGEDFLRAGTGTTFELIELQERLSETEAAEIRARAGYNKAVAEYQRQTGTTLRAYRVTID